MTAGGRTSSARSFSPRSKIIDRGDLTAGEMRGPWAGELGQLQFLPTHYLDYGVDFDGDGRVNLLKSSPDALASAANYMRSIGWRRGEPWLQEVRVPADLPWEQADLAIKLPRSQWAAWGVTPPTASRCRRTGRRVAASADGAERPGVPRLPELRRLSSNGTTSLVYSTTAAYFATRLAGAPKVGRGNGADIAQRGRGQGGAEAPHEERLRRRQDRRHHRRCRPARRSRTMQLKLGLPADSYPSQELLAKLKGG